MPDVICHGGGELSESTHGERGADGQRPETDTPETNTSAEELSNQTTSESGLPATGEDQPSADVAEPEAGSEHDPGVFKTSGSFLRERVAQTLQDQGFGPSGDDVHPDPSGGPDGEDAPSSATDESADESDAADTSGSEETGGAADVAAADEARTVPPSSPAKAPNPESDASSSEEPPSSDEAASEAGPSTRPIQPVEEESMWPSPQRMSTMAFPPPDAAASQASGQAESGAPGQGPGQAEGQGPTAEAAVGAVATKNRPEAAGKGKKKGRKAPLWWRILRVCLVLVGVGVIAGCGVFAYFYSTVEVPDAAQADAVEQGSTFYFSDGETMFAERGTHREIISYDEMTAGGEHVVEAVISAEDRGFWTEPGVSVRGTTRAVWSTITGQQVQGGSTVTQQMVRNYFEGVSNDRTVARKIQEIIIAIKIDQSETKEWVMEQYLNTIYFGRQAYGIQAAAEAYYHKDVDELTPAEAAFLAAAIQQPTPFGQANVETTPEMEQRWQYVVDGMVTTGAITQAEADAMEFPAPEPERPSAGADLSGYRGYMLQEAMNELDRLGFTEDMVNRQGYRIVTTFDEDMMEAAYQAVEDTVSQDDLPEGVNIGISTVDPATGEVVAFYGGHDYNANQYDSSFLGRAQAGSAFKPYVLATALEQGIGLNTTVDGRGPQTINGTRIQNAGNSPGGIMSLTQATQFSNNLGYIELAQRVGFEEVRQTAYDMGWPDGSIGDDQLVPVMPLGAASVRPVDQASGYGTFANGGVHVEAHVVREIVNTDGENERPEPESSRALSESTAADVTYALQQVVNSGTGTAANLWDHPTAGKTGTTNGSVAAWFVGYTPQLSTSVGVYNENNQSFSIPGQSISGGGMPAQLWNRYMSAAMEGYEPGSFPSPEFAGSNENWAPVVTPEAPDTPVEDTPTIPEAPEVPEAPEIPVDPVEPDPGFPGDPEEPGEPGTGDPGEPEEPGGPIFPPGRGEDE
ncbi:transglycosylase domain-containing protein [Nocardiopsis sp. NPDC050513]|uniref:transglycosylase domain-containing protein n=1 Tax=Nocardiopsis sp. NPDC050513 TaxID=3364338 RepID=UPI0037B4A43D